jgi:hypothetical protein
MSSEIAGTMSTPKRFPQLLGKEPKRPPIAGSLVESPGVPHAGAFPLLGAARGNAASLLGATLCP